MNLETIRSVVRPASLADLPPWREGTAWLGGGTWLFSEPQPALDRLIDLDALGWPALQESEAGLEIAATCRIAALERWAETARWRAAPLVRLCCTSLLGSFKVWNMASVGGNICMSLPAGPMTSLTAALEATLLLLSPDGSQRRVPVMEFVTGNHRNLLRPGELLRSVAIPAESLRRRFAFRRTALTQLGRSAALIVGTRPDRADGELLLTVTAATDRPVQLRFAAPPAADALQRALAAIPAERWFADVHGSAPYKRHVALHFAEEIRAELAGGVS
ncbi:MAG: FAD binding domain-containing protein [Dongiaceae bacterium]